MNPCEHETRQRFFFFTINFPFQKERTLHPAPSQLTGASPTFSTFRKSTVDHNTQPLSKAENYFSSLQGDSFKTIPIQCNPIPMKASFKWVTLNLRGLLGRPEVIYFPFNTVNFDSSVQPQISF